MDKRAEIQSIQNDSSLSQAEKSKLIQNLFTPGVGQLEEVPGNPDELSCRICLETAKREELIAPCACAGSRKWIHRACLDQWRTTREDRAFSRCTECLQEYELISKHPDSESEKCQRNTKFVCLITRDVGFAFLLSQLVVICVAYFVWICDGTNDNGYLINLLHATAFPMVFYYLCGLTLSLAMTGVLFYTLPQCPDCCTHCGRQSGYIDPCPGCYWYGPYYGGNQGAGCCCCECGGANTCCDCGACAPNAGGGCCEMCAGVDLAGDAAIFLIVIVVILAIVGIFVMIYMGSKFVNAIVRSHINVLRKRGLAEDFIVADLDESTTEYAYNADIGAKSQTYSSLPLLKEDIELGSIARSGSGSMRSGKSNMSEAQERELVRLGLLCSDDEMREVAFTQNRRNDSCTVRESVPTSSLGLIQRRNI